MCGKKPSKMNFSAGKPELTKAGTNAVGPGRHSTSILRFTHSRTSKKPGSEMAGVPASVTKAKVSPASMRSAIRSTTRCSLRMWKAVMGLLISKCLSRLPEVRVSSARMPSTSFRMRMARRVMSSKLPMGVGTR